MNKYIGEIEEYFGGRTVFKIEALNKAEARRKIIEKAEMYDDYRLDTLKIKKVQKFKC